MKSGHWIKHNNQQSTCTGKQTFTGKQAHLGDTGMYTNKCMHSVLLLLLLCVHGSSTGHRFALCSSFCNGVHLTKSHVTPASGKADCKKDIVAPPYIAMLPCLCLTWLTIYLQPLPACNIESHPGSSHFQSGAVGWVLSSLLFILLLFLIFFLVLI